ncbi:glycosyltransferase [Kitasatospora sp. NPDC057223]|uniref:glycosyltransferase n=1 Tax=Kitasatospora sp. NPDC057223 TaxID=3346055 RepID=UPI0036358B31
MKGPDRRTAAACPCPAARDSLYTPVRIVELDLDEPSGLRPPGGPGTVDPDGRVLALVRLHGHPLGLVNATGTPGDPVGLRRALVDAAHRELRVPARSDRTPADAAPVTTSATSATATPVAPPGRAGRARVPAGLPPISVIVATHNREAMLGQCLDSLLRTGYPGLEIIVVDNAPADDAAERLVRGRYAGRIRYLREPVAGVARAHNLGLAAAHAGIVAFADDDTLVDRRWPAEIAQAFAENPEVGCVTGLILPAELETAAQAALQHHGGYDKGFTAKQWSLKEPPADPLFPFTAGRFGSGANMAFRTDLLRALGGFDLSTGTGTPAHGGDDLLAFFRVVANGYVLAYRPGAIVWHRHRNSLKALRAQVYGYGAGLGAYLAAAAAGEPRMLPALVRRIPRGIRRAAAQANGRAGADGARSRSLALLEAGGMLYGPLGYLRSLRRTRHYALRGE